MCYYNIQYEYGHVSIIFFWFDSLLVPACGYSSDCRPPHCCTRTHSNKPLHQGNFALCRVYLWPRVTHMNPPPPSDSGTYLSVTFFQHPIRFIRVHMTWYICIEKRFCRVRISLGLGLGNSQQNFHLHIAAIRSHSSPKTESVLDGSTCENMSMTLLLVRCQPDII